MTVGNFTAQASFVYRVARGDIDFLTDTIMAMLLDNAYTPTAAHDALDDVSAQEVNAGTYPDYARQTLASKTITQDGSLRTVFDAADVDFGNAVTISARYMMLFKDSGVAGTSYLLGYIDLNSGGSANVSSVAGDFDVGFNASGIYRITA